MRQPDQSAGRAPEPPFRAGDVDAFAQLVDWCKDDLVNYLTRLTGARDQAEDVAQETFLRLWQHGSRYVEQGKLKAYLFRIATNLVRSRGRRHRRWRLIRALLFSPNGHRAEPPRQQSRLLDGELSRRLASALARLPLRYRAPIVLNQVEGWSYREIADLIGCREGTVKSRIFRGKRLLRQAMEPYWKGGTS